MHRAPGSPDAPVVKVGGLREDDKSRWHLPVEEAIAGIEGDSRALYVVGPSGDQIDVAVTTDADGRKQLAVADATGHADRLFLDDCGTETSDRAFPSANLPPAA